MVDILREQQRGGSRAVSETAPAGSVGYGQEWDDREEEGGTVEEDDWAGDWGKAATPPRTDEQADVPMPDLLTSQSELAPGPVRGQKRHRPASLEEEGEINRPGKRSNARTPISR